jgi:histidine triad (HIT) family protein
MDCIFCKIANKEIETFPIYEDDDFLVVLDIKPASKGHCLIISKHHDKVKGDLSGIIESLANLKKKLGFKGYALLKRFEIEHFVLNFIPIYEGKEVLYQINNKEVPIEEIKNLSEELKIEKSQIVEEKQENIIEEKEPEVIERKKIWFINP